MTAIVQCDQEAHVNGSHGKRQDKALSGFHVYELVTAKPNIDSYAPFIFVNRLFFYIKEWTQPNLIFFAITS